MNKTTRRLFSSLGIFAQFLALGIMPAEGSPGAGTSAAPAPATPAAPAPAAAAPAPAAPAAAAPAASLRDMIRAAAGVVKAGTTPAAALATLTAERDAAAARATAAEADLATARASLTSTTGTLSSVCALLGLDTKELAGKDVAAVSALVQTRIQSAVTEGLANLGFPAAQLPAPDASATATGDSIDDLRAQLNTETDPAKKGALVAKIRQLRARTTAKK